MLSSRLYLPSFQALRSSVPRILSLLAWDKTLSQKAQKLWGVPSGPRICEGGDGKSPCGLGGSRIVLETTLSERRNGARALLSHFSPLLWLQLPEPQPSSVGRAGRQAAPLRSDGRKGVPPSGRQPGG